MLLHRRLSSQYKKIPAATRGYHLVYLMIKALLSSSVGIVTMPQYLVPNGLAHQGIYQGVLVDLDSPFLKTKLSSFLTNLNSFLLNKSLSIFPKYLYFPNHLESDVT